MAGDWTISVVAATGLKLQKTAVLTPLVLDTSVSTLNAGIAPISGDNGNLDIYAKDQFGNAQTAAGATFVATISSFQSEDGGDSSVPNLTLGAPSFISGGRYAMTYSATRSGVYSVTVTESGSTVGSGPLELKIVPSRLWTPAMNAAISGDGATKAAAGHVAVFTVKGVDQYGNKLSQGAISLSVAITADNGAAVTSVIAAGTDGSSTCSYMVTATGAYSVAITLTDSGQFDPAGTASLSALAMSATPEETRQISAIKFLNNTEAMMASAGLNTIVLMQEKDEYGNLRTISLEQFSIELSGPYIFPVMFSDKTLGKYELTMAPTISGTYSIQIRAGSASGDVLTTDSFSLLVNPAAPNDTGTIIENSGSYDSPSAGSVTATNKFAFQSFDRYGNSLSDGGYVSNFDVVLTSCEAPNVACHDNYPAQAGTKVISPTIVDLSNGFYGVEYATTVSGYYSVAIKCNGQYIVNSPSRLYVTAGTTVASSSYAVIESSSCAKVLLPGEIVNVVSCTLASDSTPSTFGVRLVDTYGNTRYRSSASDETRYTTASVSTLYNVFPPASALTLATARLSIQQEDGLQSISFTATVSGLYRSSINHFTVSGSNSTDNGPIKDSPATIFVQPASAHAQHSYGTGPGLTLATAGMQTIFSMTTRDIFMNTRVGVVSAVGEESGWSVHVKRTVEMNIQQGYEKTGQVTGHEDGNFSVGYTVTKAGDYTIHVKLNGGSLSETINMSGSPFNMKLYPDIPAGPSYVVKGHPGYLSSGKVFTGRVSVEPIRVDIRSVDQFGNINTRGGFDGFNSTITLLPTTTIDHIDHSNGSYTMLYRVTKTGTYVVDVKVRGMTIIGSPVTMTVNSGPSVPETAEVFPLTAATAGNTIGFPILSKDEYSNFREKGGDPFSILCSNGGNQILEGQVFDFENGSYTGLCYMTKSGTYEVSVKVNDYRTDQILHVIGSPFTVQVYANTADPTSSGAFGEGLSLSSAGEWSTFKIFARDRFYNPNTGGAGANFNLVVRPSIGSIESPAYMPPVPICPSPFPTPEWGAVTSMPSEVESGPCADGTSTSVDLGGGTFVISYMWTLTGRYGLEVSILTAAGVSYLGDSPFTMVMKPGVTDITRSTASGDAYTLATSGETMTFLISTQDRFGNTRSSSGGYFSAGLMGFPPLSTVYNPGYKDLNTGKFVMNYTVTASGKYFIKVFNDMGSLKNSPSNITIFPARSEPTAFIVTGGGISIGLVGDDAPIFQRFIAQAKDRFSNIKTQGGDVFYTKISGGWRVSPDGLQSPVSTISTVVQDQSNGTYNIMYTTTKSGSYEFTLQVKHPLTGIYLHTMGSPFTVEISSGAISEISPFISVQTGEVVQLTLPDSLNVVTAGKNNFFIVVAKDKYGNPRTTGGGEQLFDLKMVWAGKWGQVGKELPPMNMTITCNVSYVGDTRLPDDDPRIPQFPGQYRVIYPATVSGLYRLVAIFNSKAMLGHHVGVEPAETSPILSSVSFPANNANGESLARHTTAGVRYFFTVFSRDQFHNLRTLGGDKVSVDVSGGRNSDAFFDGNLTDALTATALQAPMHPEDAEARLGGTAFGIEFKRVVCDKACVIDSSDGSYLVYINPTISGQYQADVSMGSAKICQTGCRDTIHNPYTLTTVSNDLFPPLSIATGEGLQIGTAGQDFAFTIQARDIYGNNRVHGRYTGNAGIFGGEFFASFVKVNGALITPDFCNCTAGTCRNCDTEECYTGAASTCSKQLQAYPKVKDQQDGTYVVALRTTQSSHYSIAVSITNLHIVGSPFQTLVKPHVTEPSTCVASGEALYKTNAGATMAASVQAKDEFGNTKTLGGDIVQVVIIHTDYPNQCDRTYPDAQECIRCEYRDAGCNLLNYKKQPIVEGDRKPLNVHSNLTDSGTGFYTFHYVATVSGQYKLHIRVRNEQDEFVEIGAKTVFRSPFPLTCRPGVLDPQSSTISGEGSELATVLDETNFLLWPRDRFGNVLVGTDDGTAIALCGVGSDCTPKPGETFVKLSFFNYDNSMTYQVQEKYSRGIVKLAADVAIKAVARANNDGSTSIYYTMVDIGKYSVTLEVLDTTSALSPPPYVQIRGSPFNMTVYPDDQDPDPTRCSVKMSEKVFAGVRGEGMVWLRNQYGISLKKSARNNMIEIVQILGNPSTLEFRTMNQRDGSFIVNFSPTCSGSYSFSVRTVDKDSLFVDMMGSPTTTVVMPSDTDPKTCIAFVTNVDRLIAGAIMSYTMQSRDKFGNDADTKSLRDFDYYDAYLVLSGDQTQTRIQGTKIEAADSKFSTSIITSPRQTTYVASFKNENGDSLVTRSGQYTLYSTNLDVDIVNSPYVLNVIPARLAPAVAVVDSSQTTICTAGIFSSVRIQAKDQFGNVRTDGGDENFVVIRNSTLSPLGAFSFKTQYLIEGKTDAAFRAEKAGKYLVHVVQAGIQLLGSPFYTEVLPAVASAQSSYNSSAVPSVGIAGEKLSFSIQAVDEFGNFHFSGGARFDVVLKGLAYMRTYIGTRLCAEVTTDLFSCVTITDQKDGVYVVEFTPLTSSDYIVEGSLIALDNSRKQIGKPGTSSASPWTQCVSCVNTLFPDRACEKCRTLAVNPATVDVDTSTILGSSADAFSSGEEEEFFIYARDIFGNLQTKGGLDVVATVMQIQAPFDMINMTTSDLCINANKCGQYSVTYVGTTSGLYMLSVAINGNISKTPQMIRGYPAPSADPTQSGLPYIGNDGLLCKDVCSDEKCCLYGETVSFGLTGTDMTFEIFSRDRFGNDLTRGGETFTLDISGPMIVSGMIEDLENGRYIAKYKVLLQGVYVVALRLRGIHVGKMIDECPEADVQCFGGSPTFGLHVSEPGTGLEGLIFSGDLPPSTSVAGLPGTFNVDASDATAQKKFENSPFTVSMSPVAGGVSSTPQSQLIADVYRVDYNVQKSGLWRLSVTAGGEVHCVGSPFSLMVYAAGAVPLETLITSTANVETLIPAAATSVRMAAVKNKAFSIYIIPRDEFGNERVSAELEDNVRWFVTKTGDSQNAAVQRTATRQLAAGSEHAGQYQALFTASAISGQDFNYFLQVFVAGQLVAGEKELPILVYDSVGAVSPMTVAYGAGLQGGVAGATVTFTIYARDAAGCQLSEGGNSIIVKIDGTAQTTITDNADGTYRSSHVFNDVGSYMLEILVGGQKIKQVGGLFSCMITPGVPAPIRTELERSQSWIRMNGIDNAMTSTMSDFQLVLKDEYGNSISEGIGLEQISVSVSGPSYAILTIQNRYCTDPDQDSSKACARSFGSSWHDNDGTYLVSYASTAAGRYTVSVSVLGQPVFGSPFIREAGPNIPSVLTSYANGFALSRGNAGVEGAFVLALFDSFGNPIEKEAMVNVTLDKTGSQVSTTGRTVMMAPGSEYEGYYTATLSGDYQLTLFANLWNIQGSPYSVKIEPGEAHFSQCHASGPALQSVIAGEVSTFTIVARDRYGNERTVGGDDFKTSVAGPQLASGSLVDFQNGTYLSGFSITLAGVYTLTASLGVNQFVFVYPLPCLAAAISGLATELVKRIPSEMEAGLCRTSKGERWQGGHGCEFFFQARDRYGSEIKNCQDVPVVTVESESTLGGETILYNGTTADITTGDANCQNGYFTGSLARYFGFPDPTACKGPCNGNAGITRAGTYSISILVNGQTIFGSPFRTVVSATDAFPQSCVANAIHVGMGAKSAQRDSTAGTPESFLIQSRDLYGNNVLYDPFKPLDVFAAVMQTLGMSCDEFGMPLNEGAVCLVATVKNNFDSTHTVSYTPRVSGKYELTATLVKPGARMTISNSPFKSVVKSSIVSVENSVVNAEVMYHRAGKLIMNSTADAFTSFNVIARDEFDNIVENSNVNFEGYASRRGVVVGDMASYRNDITLMSNNDGTYEVSYTVTFAAMYTLSIEQGGLQIKGSPFELSIVPGKLLPSACTCQGGGFAGGMAGIPTTYTIVARDLFGNQLLEGGAQWTVHVYTAKDLLLGAEVSSIRPVPVDNNDGTYLVTYLSPETGPHRIMTYHMKNGLESEIKDFYNDGVIFMVDDGYSVPGQTVAFGSGIQGGRAGQELKFTTQIRNEVGLNRPFGGISLNTGLTLLSGDLQIQVETMDVNDGTYKSFYKTQKAGIYQLVIKMSTDHILGSPFVVTIFPAATSAQTSGIMFRSLVSIVAEVVTFQIISRDEFYNEQQYDEFVGPDPYIAKLETADGEGSFYASVLNNEDGTYQASYVTTRAGAYMMYLTLEGRPVDTRDDVTVSPGDTVTENCFMTGSGTKNMEAGQVGFLEATSLDLYGNLVQTGLENFNVTLTQEGGNLRWLGLAQHCDSTCISKTSCPCTELKPGFYGLSYQVTVAANYKLSVELNKNLLSGFPIDIAVSPSMVETTKVSIVGCEALCQACQASSACAACNCPVMNNMLAGLKATFKLESRDRFGNKVLSGGKSFRAVMAKEIPAGRTGCFVSEGCTPSTVEGELYDGNDGSYEVSLIGSVPGNYVLNLTRSGIPINGAPFALAIRPGAASSAPDGSSFLLDPIATAGSVKTFTIQARDNFGNKLSVGGEQFVTKLVGTSAAFKKMVIMGDVGDDKDGTYFSYFITEKAGLYNAIVQLDGMQIYPGMWPITVFPAAVNPITSSVSGTGLDVLQSAGDAQVDLRYIAPEIRIVPRDIFGNVYSFDGLHIEAVSAGPRDIGRSTRDKQFSKFIECGAGCGEYVIYNPLTIAGSYSINVMLHKDGVAQSLLANGPVVFQLDSSTADSSMCTYDQAVESEAKKCTTDKVCTFEVQSVDYFGNNVEQRGDLFEAKLTYITPKPISTFFTGASSESVNAAGGVIGGKYVMSYSVTVSGQYVMQLSRYGLLVANSPSIVEISPDVPVAKACTTNPVEANDGLGMIGGKQFDELSVTVYARDKFGNVAKYPSILGELSGQNSVSITHEDGSAINADPPVSLSGGRYLIKYTPTRVGKHEMIIKFAGAGDHIVGSPFTVDIAGTAIDQADNRFTTIQDGSYMINTVNTIKSIPLYTRNNVGTPSQNAGARYEARLENALCGECMQAPVVQNSLVDYACCIDHTLLTPEIMYFSRKAGLASLSVVMVRFDQLENPQILNSPFEVQILPDATVAQTSALVREGSGALVATAGLSNKYVLVARDIYENQQIFINGAVSDISITLLGPGVVGTTLNDGADGTFAVFYKITRAGDYSMAIKIAGAEIKGSPFAVQVNPDNLFVRASTSYFSVWKTAESGRLVGKFIGTAGVANTAFVQSRDAFGNVYPGSDASFSMSMANDITFTRTMKSNEPGIFKSEWNLEKSGTYFGAIFGVTGGCTSALTCANVKGSPFIVEILPSYIVPEKCRVYGAGTTYSVANENGVVFVLARDKFGNDVVSEDSVDLFEMKLSSAATKRNSFYEYDQQGVERIVLDGQNDGASTAGIKMIYNAMMPGRYEIDVHYNKTRIGGTSGAFCGPDKPCPIVGKAVSPVTLQAKFSDSGGHIYVDFDQQTNKANLTGAFSCDVIFKAPTVAILAANPTDSTCRFLSATKLDIVLGFGATVLVNEDLVWKPEVLKRRFVCSSPQICFDYSESLEGKFRVKRPSNPVSPTAILKAPASVGPCDSLSLDASSSYGSAGRQLQYFFGLVPGTKNDRDVRNFILALVVKPYTLNTIEIPKHLLMVGEMYRFVVKVSNFLDSSHTDLITIRKVADSGPAVFVEGPNTAIVRSSQAIKLRGSAKLSVCHVGAEDIDWMWSVTSSVPSSMLLLLNEQTKDTRNLYIPDNSLVPGFSYFFTLTGKMQSNETNYGEATVQVDCSYAPVIARISGGDQAVSMNKDLTLDATGSLDLDGDKAVGNFNYKWACQNAAGTECFDDADGLMLRDSGTLELAQGMLVPGVYLFSIIVSKEPGPRTASTSVTVYVMPTPQMAVSVLPLPQAKVNANERLVLDATFETGCGGSQLPNLEWTQSSGDNVLQYPLMISTPVTLRGLAFKPNILVPGATYRFRLTARCPLSTVGPVTAPLGFGEIDVKVNVAPSSGQFQVTPMVGRGTEDAFTLKLVNWVDDSEDLPFKYEFRYATENSPADQVPLGTVDINSIVARLPGPTKDPVPSHKIVLLAFVVDQYSASTKSEITVTVLRTNSTGGSRRLLAFSASLLDQHVATGNVEGMIQMTISLSNEEALKCIDKESMIGKLKTAAGKVVMNKAEVAGFSYAVKSAMGGDCVAGSGSRRLLSDSATENALELTGSLVGNSMSAGLDPTAERGMADTLSSSLGSISTKNTARRSLRRLLSMNMYMQHGVPETPPFFRGRQGRDFVTPRKLSEGQYHLMDGKDEAEGASQKGGNILMGARDSLMSSQLNGALTGEDSKDVGTEKIAMSAQQKTPAELAGAKLGTGSSSFATPASMFSPGAGDYMQAKSSNLVDSPFDSDNDVGNVAGLSMGVSINNLQDPIELEMPSKSSARRAGSGPPIQYKCVGEDGKIAALTYWTFTDCVAGCANKTTGVCIEMSNDGCQKDEWDSCVDGEVDTCRFWNSKINDWDGEGCIVQGSVSSGGVMCHCYHLTDFGGAGSDLMPKMNLPDPTNPGAAFKNIGADKILVIAILCLFLLSYWGLFYWGWRQDRIDNERMDAMDGKEESLSKAQERKMRNSQQDEALVQGNNFRLLQKAMNGKMSKSMMMIRNTAIKLFKGKHKLFSAFFAKRHHYTRPRRFTVLFTMLLGNMFINGLFCGSESASMIQKMIMGVIAAMIMVPVTLFFKWIFMSLDVDPRTRARWEKETNSQTLRKKQEMAMTITAGPAADGISAPPPHLRGVVPPRKIVRGYVPQPDHARMGVTSRMNTFATKFRRKLISTAVEQPEPAENTKDDRCRPFTPVSLGRQSSTLSSDSTSSGSGEYQRQQEVGAYLPRRALPMRSSPRPPAPSVLSSNDEHRSFETLVPLHLTREMDDGPAEQREALKKHDTHSKKETRRLTGRAKFEAAVAKKLVAVVSKPSMDEKKNKRKKLIDYRFQYMAYFLATMWYGICFYFCLILGVTFSREIERAWLMALFLAIVQDLFINETMVISISTTVKMVLIPNIAALLSGRIAKKYS